MNNKNFNYLTLIHQSTALLEGLFVFSNNNLARNSLSDLTSWSMTWAGSHIVQTGLGCSADSLDEMEIPTHHMVHSVLLSQTVRRSDLSFKWHPAFTDWPLCDTKSIRVLLTVPCYAVIIVTFFLFAFYIISVVKDLSLLTYDGRWACGGSKRKEVVIFVGNSNSLWPSRSLSPPPSVPCLLFTGPSQGAHLGVTEVGEIKWGMQ